MSNAITPFPDHPLMAAFIAAHGAVVKSPASFARTLIKEYARTHWAYDIDPDTARLMTFSFNAAPASAPYPAIALQSLTLTETLLQRYHRRLSWFNGFGYVEPYNDGGIELRLVGELLKNFPVHTAQGIYTQSNPQVYDATTHVNIRPADFKRFVKDTDLRSRYRAYLSTFWTANAHHYPLLAKAAFIKAAVIQARENSLLETDKHLALRAMGLPALQQWSELTPEHLQAPAVRESHVVISPLKVHRYSSTDILVIKDTQASRVLLYIPGNSSPLHGFDGEQAMAEWLAEQCRDPDQRRALELHFKEQDDNDGLFLSGLRATLEGVAIYPTWRHQAAWPPRHCLHSGAAISGDPFVFVRDSVEQRLIADARTLIRSQGDERLDGLAQGLSKSLLFTGLVALVVPEALPFIVGLSITLMGVGTAQAVVGKTLEQRRAGVQRVEFGLFNALPLAAAKAIGAIVKARASTALVEPIEPSGEAVPVVASDTQAPIRPRFDYEPPVLRSLGPPLRQSLRTFEAPPASVQGRPTIHGPNGMLDIHHADGRYFLPVHDKAYEVRWEEVARRWRIVSPDGEGRPGPFVRQLENDQWDIDEGGLRGGMESSPSAEGAATPVLSHSAQVEGLYPGFSSQQVAEFLAQLRASGTSVEIQLARLSMDFRSLERSLERWINGPVSGWPMNATFSASVTSRARRTAAEIIKRCWQRQTPVEGIAARHIDGFMLNLSGVHMGDLPHLPGDFSHVTAINLSRTFISHQSVSALLGKCPNLRWLNVENNFLAVVPLGIRELPNLTRLTLAHNRIVLNTAMMETLRRLPNLRLLNLEHNPLGPLLDVSSMPQLLNLFLRNTGISTLPAGVCEVTNLLALDLRGNLLTTLPEAFITNDGLVRHTLLDGNPLSPHIRGLLAMMRAPVLDLAQGDSVEFWLDQTPALERSRRRDLWDLFSMQEHAQDFFEVIARLEGSADFEVDPAGVTERVWQVLEGGAQDETLRTRLIAMAAHPETCSDGAAVMFGDMELEVMVSRAKALAVSGRQGPQLLNLLRGLFRLEEVDAIARQDAAARVGFNEDVEVMLAYRVGLASRLQLPVGSRTMVYTEAANVPQSAIDAAERIVRQHETPEALVAFALKREFWVSYLQNEYADQFLICQRPTAQRMEALDDQQSLHPLTDAAYKDAADAIMHQRREDERKLMQRLTETELAGAGHQV